MLRVPSRDGGLLPGAGAFRLAGLLCCAALAAVTASVPVDTCPDHTDCAREGRQFCTPGSSQCGPCLTGLEENEEGNCVTPEKRHYRHGKRTSLPDLDEEIDYLSSVIAKQQDVKQQESPSWSSFQFQSEERVGQSGLKSVPTTAKPTTHSPSTSTQHTSKPNEPRTDSSGRGKPIAIPFPRDSLLVRMYLPLSVSLLMFFFLWLFSVDWRDGSEESVV